MGSIALPADGAPADSDGGGSVAVADLPPCRRSAQHPTRGHTLPGGAGAYSLSTTPARDGAHLCTIHCVAHLNARPDTVWALLTHPGTANAGVWRDVKAQTHRVVEAEEAGTGLGAGTLRTVTVTQVGEVRLAVKTIRFETHLRVVEDGRRSGEGVYATDFGLARPGGALRRFHGRWAVSPDTGPGRGTIAVLDQEVCPAGVPPGLGSVPVVGGLVRGACSRAVKRMVEDLAAAAVRAEADFGGGVDALLAELAAARG